MSALFPLEKNLEITDDTQPLTQTGSIQVYIQLAEPKLFVQGFDANEFKDRPPTLLRGSLVLRILKPAKIKTINLTFKGMARTEWPEGIPPKRSEFMEENILVEHTWPFFNHQDSHTSGADIIKSPKLAESNNNHDKLGFIDDVSSLSLDNISIRSTSNALNALKRVASPSPSRARSSSMKSAFTKDSNTITSVGNGELYVFQPGDYVYNFEHLIPASTPESVDATFGSISYSLNLNIERIGAFKSNIYSTLPIRVIRSPSDESVEDSEPIAISRDWEDQLHYDIVIASKAIILNAYLPIAFKLTPLAKIKLHRIRIYLTENLEYYCRNKKVHRMEPTKKYLMLELKAPPPKDLPADADAKAKKMGNLLTSDGEDLTAKEFEFQVFIPQKLNNRQNLHPNTSYQNIKSHHWVKICLRLSRILDGKPKHYEISIDSPIHVLDPSCSHANTLLPAYGLETASNSIPNHESNIYFPKDLIPSSPPLAPLSPEVEPIYLNNNQNAIQSSISQVFHTGRSRSSSTNTILRGTSPAITNRESTISNIYKPDPDNLQIELTSPQAIAVSPVVSPATRPIHLIRRPSFEPPPFDADISPPPIMRAPLESPNPLTRDRSNTRGLSPVGGNPLGISGILAGDVGLSDGIDSMIQSPPSDPPTYDDAIKELPNSPLTIDTDGIKVSKSIPEIQLTRASPGVSISNTTSPIVPQQESNEDDLAGSFAFHGGNLNMPAPVVRSVSPAGQRIRSNIRDIRSGVSTANNSRRGSFISTVSDDTPRDSSEILRRRVGSRDHNIDNVLNDDDEADNGLESYRGRSGDLIDDSDGSETRIGRSRMSSRSSISPTGGLDGDRSRIREGYSNEDDDPIEGMEPLLHSTTTASYPQSLYSFDGNNTNDGFRGRFESRESLSRREPTSIDITALYTNNHPGFLRDLERNHNLIIDKRNNSFSSNFNRRNSSIVHNNQSQTQDVVVEEDDNEQGSTGSRNGSGSTVNASVMVSGGDNGENEGGVKHIGELNNGPQEVIQRN